MNAHILALGCLVPEFYFLQGDLAATLDNSLALNDEESKRLQSIFLHSKIEKRHTVIEDYKHTQLKGTLFGDNFPQEIPDVEKRNQIYKKLAPQLAAQAASKALKEWGKDPKTITHVISVSCTGMYAPGIEFHLIEALNLAPQVERLGINFMGCFGAFKGLAIAKALAKENSNHRVLVVCTELCSLHFQADRELDTFVANALFSDGAAAAIVGCDLQADEQSIFEIERQSSFALTNTQELMTWEISKTGMIMNLSQKIPQLLRESIASFSEKLLGKIPFSECTWAIHPGGKAILKSIEAVCDLTEKQTGASWKVLEKFGNMSSATFLFVLDEIRNSSLQERPIHDSIIGLGFGPGLSIEGIILKASS